MNKPDIDTYQGRWPFEPTEAAHAASKITEDDGDAMRGPRGIVVWALVVFEVMSLTVAMVFAAAANNPATIL